LVMLGSSDMRRLKSIPRLIVICIFSLIGIGVILMLITNTNVNSEILTGFGMIAHVGEGRISKGSATSSTLFDTRTESAVLNCITGEVIGMRPRHIDTIDIRQLPSSNHSEPDLHRKAIFSNIFRTREWGKNPKVDFSASGKNTINASLCQARSVGLLDDGLLRQLISLTSSSVIVLLYHSLCTILQKPEN